LLFNQRRSGVVQSASPALWFVGGFANGTLATINPDCVQAKIHNIQPDDRPSGEMTRPPRP
jgi:hypothetical protein